MERLDSVFGMNTQGWIEYSEYSDIKYVLNEIQ